MLSLNASRLRRAVLIATTIVLIADCARAIAQTSLEPFDGLFRGLNTSTARQRLDFTFAVSESYDGDVPGTVQQLVPGEAALPLEPGSSTLWLSGINYYKRHRRTEFQAIANSALRYSTAVQHIENVGQTGGFLVAFPLPARTSLTLTENGAYSPALLQSLFPAQGANVDASTITSISRDYTTQQSDAYYATTTLSLAHAVGRRGRLEGGGDYQYNNYPDTLGSRRRLTIYGGHGEFSRSIGRNTSLRVAYHYRTGEYGFQNLGTTSEHGVDFGVEHSRRVSARLRALFGVAVGTSTIGTPSAAEIVGATVLRRYPTTGEGHFALQFERTWQVRASYSRGVQYVGDVAQPVLADRLGLALDGLLTKRTDLQASAAYSNGDGALITGTRFRNYTGDIRWRGALTGTLATFIEGYLYVYDFHNAPIELGLPMQLNRVGARAGLMLWVPTIGRQGR